MFKFFAKILKFFSQKFVKFFKIILKFIENLFKIF